jgi:hypothetical protein
MAVSCLRKHLQAYVAQICLVHRSIPISRHSAQSTFPYHEA